MIVEMDYPVPLSDNELLLAADLAGRISKQIAEKELEFDKIKRNFRDSIADLREALRLQLQKMETKTDTRFVKLEIKYNQPTEGKKQIYSASGELYETTDMTEDDWENIFVDSEIKDQSEESELSELSEEEKRKKGIPFQSGICHKCRTYATHVFHYYEKPICADCLEKHNKKYLKNLDDLSEYWKQFERKPQFRASFYYTWDLTVFTFMLQSGSWGNPIAHPGDFNFESSAASLFLQNLIFRGFEKNEIPVTIK